MKPHKLFFFYLFFISLVSCSNKIEYTAEYMEQTSGKYLFSQDEIIESYYSDNTLYFKWRGADNIKPVILDDGVFFMIEMNEKLRFVEHPKSKERFLSKVSKENMELITYDFLKVTDTFKTPSMYLKIGDYDNALLGYMAIKEKDSTSILVEERSFNSLGYEMIRKKKYDDAIGFFKINVALYPESDNVYDSLGDGYLLSGDSLQAYNFYKIAYKRDSGNRKAKKYVETYNKQIE